MNLPADQQFMVSYRLIPVNDAELTKPVIRGVFSFLIEEKTVTSDILQAEQDLDLLSGQQVVDLIASLKSKPAENMNAPQIDIVADNSTNISTTKVSMNRNTEASKKVADVKVEKKKTQRTGRKNAHQLEPEDGVYYRIQLAAGHKPVDVKRYFKKFNLEMDVKKEEHAGWTKYSIGSFPVYKDARDYRVHIWNTTPIGDAFVAAYNNGNRITVQEALMIADQRWYK
ncbi:MAG: hypothetical protein HC906_13975 [Bacteroidales bacterium]|nr:hypothetical protein [Bacteroidales bacterium]